MLSYWCQVIPMYKSATPVKFKQGTNVYFKKIFIRIATVNKIVSAVPSRCHPLSPGL